MGNFFQIYDASSLHLLFVSSPKTPSTITALFSHFHYVFAAWSDTIGIFKRGRMETSIVLEGYSTSEGEIKAITLFGEYLCAATTAAVYIYKVNPKEPSYEPEYYTTLRIPKSFGAVKTVIHPQTYLNKLAIVADTTLLLYNVRTGRLLFTSEEFDSAITAVECSPVLDVLGIGTASGDIHLYHLRQGRILFTLNAGERVTSITFRTDGQPLLGVGTAAGNLLFYHLDTKKRVHIIRDAHRESSGGVANVKFFNGQPIFVTNGGDNFLSEYVFDPTVIYSNTQSSAESANAAIASPPRLLRSRGGHSLPPTQIHFTDENAHHMLSASRDQSLWSFSLRKDSQNHEFSQREKRTDTKTGLKKAGLIGSMKDKFPEITSIAYQASKQGRWDTIITAHKDLTYAHTWDGHRGIVGNYRLATPDGGLVKTVALSGCGNFGLVGSSLGGVAVYNMQSGLLRKKFVGHTQSVTGIAIDSLNRMLITTSLDGQVRFYNFKTGKLEHRIKLGSSATEMNLHLGSDLLAISLDNLSIVVIDIQTKKTVRELWGHSNRITSFDFSPDGRWIISAALDSTIRTWDLPTGGCIDIVRVDNLVTCLRMSPNGDWLATTHVQGVGISLWTNRSQFKKVAARVLTEEEEEAGNIAVIDMPNAGGEGGANIIEGAYDEDNEDAEEGILNSGMSYRTMDRLSDELITLSLLPRSKFNTLTHLDTIKLRNKAKEAPKKPVKAPFFLSVGNKRETTESKEIESTPGMRPKVGAIMSSESDFTRLLREFCESHSQDGASAFIANLKSLSPSSTDLEIRSLSTFPPLTEFIGFIDALTATLERHSDFELVQAWMAMLLRVHGDVIMDHATTKVPELGEALLRWESVQSSEALRLGKLARYCAGVLDFLKTA